jgi:Neprosin
MASNDKPDRIPSITELLDTTSAEEFSAWSARPETKVRDAAAFEEMKSYIANRYSGVEVVHSFIDSNGQIFDCIPIEQQPSLHGRPAPMIAEPPDLPPAEPAGLRQEAAVQIEPQLAPGNLDQLGNPASCPPGTIPVRRVTLAEMARFETVQHFRQKSPVGKGRHPRLSGIDPQAGVHKYAHAFQTVNNLGGHNFLNVWRPAIGANQIFSLSQHWYSGGSGASLQTAEVGWQVYPGKYGNPNPVLFIYWTADDYNSTGCYNLDCTAFVQVNSTWMLGGALSSVSVSGGNQAELEVAYYNYQGNWWLYLGGMSRSQAVGYYPASLYGTGQLARNATGIDYGGETVGTASWPPMGSGAFASTGYQKAAYQRNIYYFTTSHTAQFANLTAVQNSPSCYTIDVH